MTPRLKIQIGMAALFLAGLVIGSVVTCYYIRDQMTPFYKSDFHQRRQMMVERLTKELGLSAAQKTQIDALLREHQMKNRPAHAQRIKERMNERFDLIRDALNGEQKQKLEEHRRRVMEQIDENFDLQKNPG